MKTAIALFILFAATSIADAQPRKFMTYRDGYAKAIKTDSQLWTYVGIPANPAPYSAGTLVCQTDKLPGYPAKCIVVSYPAGGGLWWQATLDPNGNIIDEPRRQTYSAPASRSC